MTRAASSILVLGLLFAPAASMADESGDGAGEVEQPTARDSAFIDDENRAMRVRALQRQAFRVGAKVGTYHIARRINNRLEAFENTLDRAYDFESLLIRHEGEWILPPVIDEIGENRAIEDRGRVIRSSERIWQIEQEPRFIVRPPHWRDYLIQDDAHPKLGLRTLQAEDEREEALIRDWFDMGLEAGREGAMEDFRFGLARLERNLTGIGRYHLMHAMGMVTEPQMTGDFDSVSGGGDELVLAPQRLEISVTSNLRPDSEKWRALPRLPDHDWLTGETSR